MFDGKRIGEFPGKQYPMTRTEYPEALARADSLTRSSPPTDPSWSRCWKPHSPLPEDRFRDVP